MNGQATVARLSVSAIAFHIHHKVAADSASARVSGDSRPATRNHALMKITQAVLPPGVIIIEYEIHDIFVTIFMFSMSPIHAMRNGR